jgi:predicted RNA-binding Zn ribbon-like protein
VPSLVINSQSPNDHRHEADLGTALDFLNTLDFDDDAVVEYLKTPADAIDWLAAHGLIHADDAQLRETADEALLERVRRIRDSMREVVTAVVDQRPPRKGALDAVNRAMRSREVIELVKSDDGVSVGHRHIGDPVDNALAGLADPVVLEIASGRPDRLRICASDGCRWVFYDDSRAGRRRWCDMATCGNREKAARFRARKRTAAETD